MIWSLSRKSNSEKLKAQAKADYEFAANSDKATRSFRVKIALRCRAHIDRAFINSAKAAEAAENDDAEADSENENEVTTYQLVKSADGYIYTYIPEDYAVTINQLGHEYQDGLIDTYTAITKAQVIADQISEELQLPDSFQTLSFLQIEDSNDVEHDQ
ncbi:MAG: hypothetical protein ACE37D_18630 [Pseudomonadales bacterium]